MRRIRRFATLPRHWKWAIPALVACGAAWSAGLALQVRAPDGMPVEDAVVYLTSAHTAELPVQSPSARIDQINKEFVPLVSVVQTGTRVSFPNKDNIRHHVYSFSAAKKFEIKLYADTPSKPILFDKAGYVVMGCNIHDTMIAHLLVVDTPYFAVTDAQGKASIKDVPPGDYSLIAWYYARPDKSAAVLPISLKTDAAETLTIKAGLSD